MSALVPPSFPSLFPNSTLVGVSIHSGWKFALNYGACDLVDVGGEKLDQGMLAAATEEVKRRKEKEDARDKEEGKAPPQPKPQKKRPPPPPGRFRPPPQTGKGHSGSVQRGGGK